MDCLWQMEESTGQLWNEPSRGHLRVLCPRQNDMMELLRWEKQKMMKFILIAMESNGRVLHRARTMSFLLFNSDWELDWWGDQVSG